MKTFNFLEMLGMLTGLAFIAAFVLPVAWASVRIRLFGLGRQLWSLVP